jgi:hypothetical protein
MRVELAYGKFTGAKQTVVDAFCGKSRVDVYKNRTDGAG